MADIYRKFLVLSAGFKLRWQTYTGNSWFCLPGSLPGGRHIQENLGFVCRVHCLAADIYRKFLDLSAGYITWRQTNHRKSKIYLPGLPAEQVYGSQEADMDRHSAVIAKDCRYDKSLRYRSENLPERCTKIRPYKEKIQA